MTWVIRLSNSATWYSNNDASVHFCLLLYCVHLKRGAGLTQNEQYQWRFNVECLWGCLRSVDRPIQLHSQRAIIDLAHQHTALLQDGLYGTLGPLGPSQWSAAKKQHVQLDSRHSIFWKVVDLHHIHVLAWVRLHSVGGRYGWMQLWESIMKHATMLPYIASA